ncbi:carbonic anhydrase 9 isoform X2 [Pleurodeles waltl]|uniref:carbonic anhydrase 9 isoform X2 n=1 Tax=Pleurodeles waltl TaxID=8319 RepID=UPI003709B2D4
MARLCLLLVGLQALALGATTQEDHGGHRAHPGHRGPPAHHWTYEEKTVWDEDFADCGGKAQSPININTSSTTFDPALLPIVLQGYNLTAEQTLRLNNNGHTVVLQLPKELSIVEGLPLEYRAAQLHFHWGSPERPGSEHTVNGEHYPGEIHMVYFSSEYSSIKEAMDKPGGLAVLGGFIEVGPEENPYYAHLLEYFDKVATEGEDTKVPGFDISGLLPTRMDRYFRYNGSLTTPPCFQTVNWTVFNDTIKISPAQLSVLEDTIHGDDHEILHLNFRDPQSLNGRPVLASFRPPVGGRRGLGPGHADTGSSPVSPAPGSDPSDGKPVAHPGTHPEADAEETPGSRNSIPDNGDAEHLTRSSLGTGDMLAIIFGVLFAVTAVAFFVYVRKQRSKNRRMNSEDKPNVIYKAATTEENIA